MGDCCIIKEGSGLGDIFFVQKIVIQYSKMYTTIYYPILDKYKWVIDCLEYPDNVKFPIVQLTHFPATKYISVDGFDDPRHERLFMSDMVDVVETHEFTYLPLADTIENGKMKNLVMIDKYNRAGLDWRDWESYFKFKRDMDKERRLFYDVLGLTDDTEYILRNNMYLGTVEKKDIKIDDNSQLIVDMEIVDGFTLLDWGMVVEHANCVHTVSTSLFFLLSKLKIKNVSMYSRYNLEYDKRQMAFMVDNHKTWKWIV
jgi:hypothetical protein